MRRLLLAVVATLLVAWGVFGIVAAIDALGAGCAEASSEVGDPCAVGKTTYLLFGLLGWCVVALPLSWRLGALRPSNQQPDGGKREG